MRNKQRSRTWNKRVLADLFGTKQFPKYEALMPEPDVLTRFRVHCANVFISDLENGIWDPIRDVYQEDVPEVDVIAIQDEIVAKLLTPAGQDPRLMPALLFFNFDSDLVGCLYVGLSQKYGDVMDYRNEAINNHLRKIGNVMGRA